MRDLSKHACNEVYCSYCSTYSTGNHICFLKKDDLPKHSDKYSFFILKLYKNRALMNLNLAVIPKMCNECENDIDINNECSLHIRQVIFNGHNC